MKTFKISLFLIFLYFIIKGMETLVIKEKTWTYELLSCKLETSDPEKLNGEIKVKHLTRTELAIQGYADINYDIGSDDDTIEIIAYRSSTGSESDYQLLPYGVPRQPLMTFINDLYKSLLMESLATCSNLPVFEDKLTGPLEQKRYELNDCQFSEEAFPNHLQEGFYRLNAQFKGQIEWSVVINVEVIKKQL
uniref:MD-2-related lipid-recognition domain-containing protein n=1 Tax=Glossina brevipalpis TaxID=37001 RepID=A0A1A9WC55_9MUSC